MAFRETYNLIASSYWHVRTRTRTRTRSDHLPLQTEIDPSPVNYLPPTKIRIEPSFNQIDPCGEYVQA